MRLNVSDMALPLLAPAEILARVGNQAKALRIRRRITQAELAAAAGVGRKTIVRMEAGEPVGTDILVRVALALRSVETLATLFRESETPTVDQVLEVTARKAPTRVARARR